MENEAHRFRSTAVGIVAAAGWYGNGGGRFGLV